MHAAGWVGISWPKEYGGRGSSFMQQVIFDEEYFRARAPILPGASAINLLGPTLIQCGTEAQKNAICRASLPARSAGARASPNPAPAAISRACGRAPSMTAITFLSTARKCGLRAHICRLVLPAGAHRSRRPQAHGISYLLVDMKTPGVTVRPLVLLNGHRHFNEVFFEDVAVPKENLVGELNEGWKVAITTLMFERSGAGGRDHAAQMARLAELARQFPNRQEPAWNESHIRQQLAQLAIDVKALQVTRLRGLTRRLRGEPPGPGRLDDQIVRIGLGVTHRRFIVELLGPYATVNAPSESGPVAARWHHRVSALGSTRLTPAPTRIQHNIIGESVLGLPKG